ncbi:MAG: hypothetical protein ISQ09_09500 [Rubripirellula sp.]|nr:hypothetical protein [Rubripirellula sp.]
MITIRSLRRTLCFGMLFTAFAASTPKLLPAQAPDAAGGDPVIVVTLGSVNKLMQDVNYVSGLVGQPQAGGIFAMMAGTFTQGIDTTQPMAITVPLVAGMPQPLALIPTADVKTVLKRLEAQTGPVDELKDGTLVIAVGVNTIYIRQQGNWAIIAPDRDVLNLAPTDPAAIFGENAEQYDLSIKLKMQKVPAPIRGMITAQMRQGFEQAMSQQAGDADTEAAREIAELNFNQIEQLITDTDELEFGFNVDQQGKEISLRTRFTAVEGSPLGVMLSSQKSIASQFSTVIRPDAAAFYHSAASIGSDSVAQAKASIQTAKTSVIGILDTQGELPPDVKEVVISYLNRIIDLTIASIEEGKSDFGAMLLAGDNNLQFAMGGFVADGNELAKIAKEIGGKLESMPDAPTFSFDREVYKGVTMHLVEFEIPATEEEARSVIGDELQLHIGTGKQAAYLALGKNSEGLLKEMVDASGTDSSSNRPMGQMQIKLLPILEFAQSISSEDSVIAMIDSLSRSTDSGKISLTQDTVPNGQEVKFSIGEGLLQAVGAAMRQQQLEAQQNAIQNGQF